jgi:hypothetical protein
MKPSAKINASSNPATSPTSLLPALHDGAQSIGSTGSIRSIINHLKRKGNDLDSNLNTKKRGEALAYGTMVEETLFDAWLWQMVALQDNFTKVTRPTMAKLLPLLDKWSGVSRLQSMAKLRLEGYRDVHEDGAIAPSVIGVLRALQTKLQESSTDWFFSSPTMTTLDCLTLAYLSCLSADNLPDQTWKKVMERETPFLLEWVEKHKQIVAEAGDVISPPEKPVSVSWSEWFKSLGLVMPVQEKDEMSMNMTKWAQVAGVLTLFGLFLHKNKVVPPIYEALRG